TLEGVVGVHQKRGVREVARESTKGLQLIRLGLHVAVRHGSEHRDAVTLRCQHVGGSDKTCDVSGACSLNGGLDAVCAAQAEVDQLLAARGVNHSRRFGRHHRFEVNLVDQNAFQELGLRQGRHHLKQRLLRKNDGSLWDSSDLAREAEALQVCEESVTEK